MHFDFIFTESSSHASSSSGCSGSVPSPEIVRPSPYGPVSPFDQDIVFNRRILARADFLNHNVMARPNQAGFLVYSASDLQPITIGYSEWMNAMHDYALHYEVCTV